MYIVRTKNIMCLFCVHLSSGYRGLRVYLANDKRILIQENAKIIFKVISNDQWQKVLRGFRSWKIVISILYRLMYI